MGHASGMHHSSMFRFKESTDCQQCADNTLPVLSISIGNRWRALHLPLWIVVRRRVGICCFTSLTPTIAKQDSGNEIWDTYLNEVKEDDKRIADGWKEDSNGIIVFVCLNPLIIPPFVSMTTDRLQDRSFLGDCWLLYH